ncbi:TPA: hypothetical protein ACQOF1_001487 [Streptococcus pyogenes]|nr:hypothetical protein [Streptococcus pyogenes]VGQ96242.1 phage protein [Streptococcus pyogenes]VGR10062.1 phage protein [Streptococcus pyogenes]VHF50419.1 phage protein [Streptococcus pyogenes]VHM10538.1 phage protein [Streptococcus pyogenes]HEP1490751.1 hypothetical protein [Streptococcus pyogenes]
MNKQNFEKLDKVKELHNEPDQFGAQVLLPSPDKKYKFAVRICREENLED